MKIPKYPLLVGLLFLFFAVTTYFHLHDYYSDYLPHSAIMNELTNLPLNDPKLRFFPTVHPLGPIPFSYDFYTWGLALIKKITGLSSLTIFNMAGLMNFILLAIGLHLFLKEYFSTPELSFILLPVMLFFWGKSWDFSGAYDVGGLMINLYKPSSFAFALSFFIFTLLIKYLRTGKMFYGFVLLPSLSILILTNLLPTFFALGTMVLLLLLHKPFQIKKILFVLGLTILAFTLATSWPYYSLIQLVRDGFLLHQMTTPEITSLYFSIEHLTRLGPVLLGVPLIFYYGWKKRYPLIVLGFFLFLASFLTAFFLKSPMGWRLIFYVSFFLHLGLALYLREKLPVLSNILVLTTKNIFPFFLVTIGLGCLLYQTVSVTAKELGFRSFQEVLHFLNENPKRGRGFIKKFQFLNRYVPSDALILSDMDTALVIPAFSGRPLTYQEGASYYDPFIQKLGEHQSDVVEFFKPETSLQRRFEIVKKYGIQFVLWNNERAQTPPPEDFKKAVKVVYEKDSLTLFEIPSTS